MTDYFKPTTAIERAELCRAVAQEANGVGLTVLRRLCNEVEMMRDENQRMEAVVEYVIEHQDRDPDTKALWDLIDAVARPVETGTGQNEEECCICTEPTGKAGKGEDSLYTEDGRGPFCEECFDIAGRLTQTEPFCMKCGFQVDAWQHREQCAQPEDES